MQGLSQYVCVTLFVKNARSRILTSRHSSNRRGRMHTDTLRPHALLNTPTATDPTASLFPTGRSVYLDFKGVGRSVIQSLPLHAVVASVSKLPLIEISQTRIRHLSRVVYLPRNFVIGFVNNRSPASLLKMYGMYK